MIKEFTIAIVLLSALPFIFLFSGIAFSKVPENQRLVCYNNIGNVVINERVSRVYFGSQYIRYYKDEVPFNIKGLGCYTGD